MARTRTPTKETSTVVKARPRRSRTVDTVAQARTYNDEAVKATRARRAAEAAAAAEAIVVAPPLDPETPHFIRVEDLKIGDRICMQIGSRLCSYEVLSIADDKAHFRVGKGLGVLDLEPLIHVPIFDKPFRKGKMSRSSLKLWGT